MDGVLEGEMGEEKIRTRKVLKTIPYMEEGKKTWAEKPLIYCLKKEMCQSDLFFYATCSSALVGMTPSNHQGVHFFEEFAADATKDDDKIAWESLRRILLEKQEDGAHPPPI